MSQQSDTNRQGKSQSYLDQTAGGALVPEEDRKAGTVPDNTTEPESDDPAGAEYLRDLHADLADLCAEYEAGLKKIEKEKVKKGVPKLLADLNAAREDVEEIFAAVYNGTTTVQQGQFVFNQFRALEDGVQKRLNGYKVTTTPQVSNTRGNGSQTFVLGGMWSKFVIAMFGAIEFMQSDQGLTLMHNDQVAIRAILTADGAAQMPGAFAFCDALNFTLGN